MAWFLPAVGLLWFGQRVVKKGILVVVLQVQVQVLLLPLERWLLSVPCGQLAALARLSGLTSAAACPLPLWSGHLGVWDRKKSSFSFLSGCDVLTWGRESDKAGVDLREAGYLTGRCRARLLLRRNARLRAQDVLDKNKDGCKASPDCPGQDIYRQQRGGHRAQESTGAPSLEPQDAPH